MFRPSPTDFLPYLSHNVSHFHHYDAAFSLWAEGHSHPPPSQSFASRQREWDGPKAEASVWSIWDLAISDVAKARLLSVSCTESGAWLNALPLSSIGLRMDDDVVRIAMGLRLGLPLCSLHTCSGCGGDVQEDGIHGLSCRYSTGCHSRHVALNDIVKRSLDAAKIPSNLEPSGLYRGNGKRLDGASVVPWQRDKILIWDATCSDTFASSYRDIAVQEPEAVAAASEHRKWAKYSHLEATHHFVPLAVESLCVLGHEARAFIRDLVLHLTSATDDQQLHQFLLQRVAVAIQRGNAAAVLGTIGGTGN